MPCSDLHTRYAPILRAVIMRVMHDPVETDDVLQEVFLQVWTRAETYCAERGQPLGWLITLARRRAIDRLRQRCAYQRACDRFEVQSVPAAATGGKAHSVEQEACGDDLRELLERLITRLPPRQQEVVKLAFFKGCSQREIAANLHLPLGTVKTRIELGVRKLALAVGPSRDKIS